MRYLAVVLALLATPAWASTPMPVNAEYETVSYLPPKPAKHHHHHHRYHHRYYAAPVMQLALFHPPTSHPRPATPVPAPAAPAADPALTIVQQLQATLPHWQAADTVAVGPDPNHPANMQAHSCFAAVVQFLEGFTGPAGGPASAESPIVAYARSTVLHAQIQPGLPPVIKTACAPLVDDDASFLSRLMSMDGLTLSQSDLAKAGF